MPALDGLRILDMTQYEAGPSCTQALARLGADVVKIEPPDGGEPGRGLAVGGEYSAYFCLWNANKRSVTLDLSKPEGRDVLLQMLPKYDVFIESGNIRVFHGRWQQRQPSLHQLRRVVLHRQRIGHRIDRAVYSGVDCCVGLGFDRIGTAVDR